jgi:hypothetical protein
VAALSKAWVCNSSLAGFASSNPVRGMDVLSFFVSVVRFQVEVPWTALSFVRGILTECGLSECDLRTLKIRPTVCSDAVEP